MFLVSVLSASVILSVQLAPPPPAVIATRTLNQVHLKARRASITQVMETLKQEAQIESAEIDARFAGVLIDGEWTAKDWDDLLFVALSGVPEMKVLVAGGPEGTEWRVVAGSAAFLAEFKLKPKTRIAETTSEGAEPTTKAPSGTTADIRSVPEVVDPVVEVQEEQEEAQATLTAIASPPAGPAIAGQHVVLPFPDENGNLPMATRQGGPLQLPFPGYEAPAATKGPFPPSKDPAIQALIDIVNQKNASKK